MKIERVKEVIAAGGKIRYALEDCHTGGSKFQARLLNATGARVKGFGMKTFLDLRDAGMLVLTNSTSVSAYYTLKG